MFKEEVDLLCGKAYSRNSEHTAQRAGSGQGSVIINGQRVSVKKPRVKVNGKEVQLRSYEMLRDEELLYSSVMQAMLSGVSTANYQKCLEPVEGGQGLSKSSVSKIFIKASEKSLQRLNSQDLSLNRYAALMVDAIHFGSRVRRMCSIGITTEGYIKRVLGLREGSSENYSESSSESYEVVKDLLSSVIDRGLDATSSMLFIIDGGSSLRKAIRAHFGHDAIVQRCAVHKERNIHSYLPKHCYDELKRRWKMLHGSINYNEAIEAHESLSLWLSKTNLAAKESLHKTGKETLTLIALGASEQLRVSLSSTNAIESCYSMVRRMAKNVKNWNRGTDQVARWAGAALEAAESRFHRVKGYGHLGLLIEAIKGHHEG